MVKIGEDLSGMKYKILGYYPNYNAAYKDLVAYHDAPPEDVRYIPTLEEMYEEWIESAVADNGWSESHTRNIRNAWKLVTHKSSKIDSILPSDIRANILSDDVPQTVKRMVKAVYSHVYDYAVAETLVTSNPAKAVTIPKVITKKIKEETKHKACLSSADIAAIASDGSPIAQMVIFNIYSGWRPAELCSLLKANVNTKLGYMVGGMKTESGKNRAVPIHPAIRKILLDRMQSDGDKLFDLSVWNYNHQFGKLMDKLGIEATPHSCRKTFITYAKACNMDEYAIKKIVGHAISDLTEAVYTDRPVSWLISEMNKLKITDIKKERQAI